MDLAHLGLEVADLGRARTFYVDRLDLPVVRADDREIACRAGEADLVLRRPIGVPRGGLHVHYAFATSAAGYDRWLDRFADLDPEEHDFGSYRSLYVDDPDDHCVEIGGKDAGSGAAATLTGIFEIVLEVRDLDRAVDVYTRLDFEVVDRSTSRPRVRLRGPFDLELWEPHLGIAGARGGVHVDLGLSVNDPDAAVAAMGDDAREREAIEGGLRVLDPDGHSLTFVRK